MGSVLEELNAQPGACPSLTLEWSASHHHRMTSLDSGDSEGVDPRMWKDISASLRMRQMSARAGLVPPMLDTEDKSIWEHESWHAPYDRWPKKGGWGYYRMYLHYTMERESFSKPAFGIFCIVMLLIIISTLAYCLETIPEWESWLGWWPIECVVSISFSVELAFRLFAARNAWRVWQYKTFYFYNFMNFVDLLAIVPFYIELVVGPDEEKPDWIRVVRIIRLARLARAFGSDSMREFFSVLGSVFKKTWKQSVTMVVTMIVLETILFASLIYVVEKGLVWEGECAEVDPSCFDKTTGDLTQCFKLCETDHEIHHVPFCRYANTQVGCVPKNVRYDGMPTPFTSIPQSMYWVMATIATVGYGDIYPIYPMGQFMACMCMLSGVLVVAIFVIIVGGNFDETAKIIRKLHEERERLGLDPDTGKPKQPMKGDDREGSGNQEDIVGHVRFPISHPPGASPGYGTDDERGPILQGGETSSNQDSKATTPRKEDSIITPVNIGEKGQPTSE